MKKSLQTSILFTIIFSLTAVLLGNSLSFHLEDFSVHTKISSPAPIASLEVQNQASDEKDVDPCLFGFCHLGHCAVLLIPSMPQVNVTTLVSAAHFFQKFNRVDRSLDVPYQPPRFA